MARHRFVDAPADARRVELGGGVALVAGDGAWLVEHVCASWPDDREADGVFVKVVAPRLTAGHTVAEGPAGITVRPSVLCPACGLHGYVTESTWASC